MRFPVPIHYVSQVSHRSGPFAWVWIISFPSMSLPGLFMQRPLECSGWSLWFPGLRFLPSQRCPFKNDNKTYLIQKPGKDKCEGFIEIHLCEGFIIQPLLTGTATTERLPLLFSYFWPSHAHFLSLLQQRRIFQLRKSHQFSSTLKLIKIFGW